MFTSIVRRYQAWRRYETVRRELSHLTGHGMMSDATRPQIAALGGISLLALFFGMVAPANWINMRLSAHDVGGLMMPPHMVMDRDTPADAMRDMSYADPRKVTASYDLNVRGDQELGFRLENAVKIFELTPSVIRWTILPGVTVDAYAYNGEIPGPRIHIKQGDRVRIVVTNRLPEETTIHWHGLILPNNMDGPAQITQPAIRPGERYTYEFTATQHGTYFYHPHAKPDRTQALGLYGALIIDPSDVAEEVGADHEYVVELQEWLLREGLTYPSMPMDCMQPNYFTIIREGLSGYRNHFDGGWRDAQGPVHRNEQRIHPSDAYPRRSLRSRRSRR
jgi:manganese oxidase